MTTEMRLIDANAYPCQTCEVSYCHQNCNKFTKWFESTVDAVEVIHASWHDVYLVTPWIATGICSHCNLKSYINPDFPWAKYCPNCGAKMDGGNEDG
jgi:hypothetical protein